MKSSQALLFVAAAASSVFAAPAPGIVVNPAPSAIAVAMVAPRPSGVAALGTDVSANPAWTGDNTLSRRGKKGTAEACESGKDECQEGLGCYGCWNHTTVCQRGPGSNECCFRDELGPVCQVIPLAH